MLRETHFVHTTQNLLSYYTYVIIKYILIIMSQPRCIFVHVYLVQS